MTAKLAAANRFICEEYAPLIRERVLPAVAEPLGRPWVERLSEHFLRKSPRDLHPPGDDITALR
jgi:hypothetical protein